MKSFAASSWWHLNRNTIKSKLEFIEFEWKLIHLCMNCVKMLMLPSHLSWPRCRWVLSSRCRLNSDSSCKNYASTLELINTQVGDSIPKHPPSTFLLPPFFIHLLSYTTYLPALWFAKSSLLSLSFHKAYFQKPVFRKVISMQLWPGRQKKYFAFLNYYCYAQISQHFHTCLD